MKTWRQGVYLHISYITRCYVYTFERWGVYLHMTQVTGDQSGLCQKMKDMDLLKWTAWSHFAIFGPFFRLVLMIQPVYYLELVPNLIMPKLKLIKYWWRWFRNASIVNFKPLDRKITFIYFLYHISCRSCMPIPKTWGRCLTKIKCQNVKQSILFFSGSLVRGVRISLRAPQLIPSLGSLQVFQHLLDVDKFICKSTKRSVKWVRIDPHWQETQQKEPWNEQTKLWKFFIWKRKDKGTFLQTPWQY